MQINHLLRASSLLGVCLALPLSSQSRGVDWRLLCSWARPGPVTCPVQQPGRGRGPRSGCSRPQEPRGWGNPPFSRPGHFNSTPLLPALSYSSPCTPGLTGTESAWHREGRVPRVRSENQTFRKPKSTEVPGAPVAGLEACRGSGALRMGPREGNPLWATLPEAFTLLVRHGWQKSSAWRSPCFIPVTTGIKWPPHPPASCWLHSPYRPEWSISTSWTSCTPTRGTVWAFCNWRVYLGSLIYQIIVDAYCMPTYENRRYSALKSWLLKVFFRPYISSGVIIFHTRSTISCFQLVQSLDHRRLNSSLFLEVSNSDFIKEILQRTCFKSSIKMYIFAYQLFLYVQI